MRMLKSARLVIYRLKEKGLEVFLVNTGDNWDLPQLKDEHTLPSAHDNCIELEPLQRDTEMSREKALAVEGDWHDIPSLKKLLLEDVDLLREQIQTVEKDNGAFFALSEALRKVTPDYNAFFRELKDIIRDRNSVKYL
jgi:phosphoenolpyruvate-protein kinase (PTS system EI component)